MRRARTCLYVLVQHIHVVAAYAVNSLWTYQYERLSNEL